MAIDITALLTFGLPGLVMGRSRHVSAGFTYGYMDMVDYFVEEIRGDTCRRGEAFVPLTIRGEAIYRKKHAPVEITIWRIMLLFRSAMKR